MSTPKLSVVIPVFNEAQTIRQIVDRVRKNPLEKEIVIVDDCSTDGTREILNQLESIPEVRVFYQDRNQGKGAALRRGVAEVRGEVVIFQDADLEYNPAEYPKLIGPILEGKADVVFGSRFAGGQHHRVLYYWHYVGNKLLTTFSNVFNNVNLTDMETCYKAFRREVIQSFKIEEDRFGIEPEVTAKVAKGGWRLYEVGISYEGRTYAEGKKAGWRDGVRALVCVVKYSLFS
ncbi:MAG: glycosyltransferase family 2 protein [Acidobacteriota bacterium]|nr:glycosyltransferase family 2 protein [Acidobacteriota bacterium]